MTVNIDRIGNKPTIRRAVGGMATVNVTKGAQGPTGATGPAGAPGGSDAAMAAWINDDASATKAALSASYGRADVVASPPTGVAATDTANLQAAIDTTPAGGVLYIPGRSPISSTREYRINAALVVSKSMTIRGDGAKEKWVAGGNFDYPTGTPPLLGSIIRQTAAATDGFQMTGTVASTNVRGLGVIFDSSIDGNTGHGFKCDMGSTANIGLCGWEWDDVAVSGHDGNHYGFYFRNVIHGTTNRLRSYGGGGFYTGCDFANGNLGNLVHNHPVSMVHKTGSAHGFAHASSTSGGASGYLNLITYIRPQCNVYSQLPSAQATWKDNAGAGVPGTIVAINPDMENAPGAPNILIQGTKTQFIGGNQLNRGDVNNTAYGVGALPNPAGGSNTALGRDALLATTSGATNVAVGHNAAKAVTSGYSNTAVGAGALAACVTSVSNTAVGKDALSTTTGEQNTAVGQDARPANAGESRTTLIGYQATAVSGAFGSVALGVNAAAGGPNALAIGRATSAGAAGAVAIGRDSASTSAATTTQDAFVLGTALHKVQVPGRLNVARRTPTGSADAQGAAGDITSDDSYVYVKTSTGWKRAALTTW